MIKIAKFLVKSRLSTLPMKWDAFKSEIRKSDYAVEVKSTSPTQEDYIYYVLAEIDETLRSTEKTYMTINEYRSDNNGLTVHFVVSSNEYNQLGRLTKNDWQDSWIPYDKNNLKKDVEHYLQNNHYKLIKVLKK